MKRGLGKTCGARARSLKGESMREDEKDERGQVSSEALVSVALMLAIIMLFLNAGQGLVERSEGAAMMLKDRLELEAIAEKLDYLWLDGRNFWGVEFSDVGAEARGRIRRLDNRSSMAASTLAELDVSRSGGGVLYVVPQEGEPV